MLCLLDVRLLVDAWVVNLYFFLMDVSAWLIWVVLLLGWLLLLFGIGLAAIIATGWLIIHDIVLKKPKVVDFPFAPFLASAFLFVLVAGIDIIV